MPSLTTSVYVRAQLHMFPCNYVPPELCASFSNFRLTPRGSCDNSRLYYYRLGFHRPSLRMLSYFFTLRVRVTTSHPPATTLTLLHRSSALVSSRWPGEGSVKDYFSGNAWPLSSPIYTLLSPPIFTPVHTVLPHDNGCCCLGYRRAPRRPSFAGEIEAHVCVRFAPRRRATIPLPPLAPPRHHRRRIDLCRPFTPTTRSRHPPSSYLCCCCHHHRRRC